MTTLADRGRARAANSTPSDRRFLTTARWLVINSALTAVLGAAFWAVATRRFEPDELGRASATLAHVILCGGIAVVGLKHALARDVAGRHPASSFLLRRGSFAAFALGSGAWGVMVVAGAGAGEGLLLDVWLGAAAGVWALFVLQDSLLPAVELSSSVPLVNTVHSIAKLGLVAVAAGSASAVLMGSWFLPVVLIVPVVQRLVKTRVNREFSTSPLSWRASIGRLGGEQLASAMWLSVALVLPSLVLWLSSAEDAADWYLGYTLGSVLYVAVSAIGSALVVSVAGAQGDAPTERRATGLALWLVIPGAAALALLAPFATLLLAQDYSGSVGVIRIVALGAIPFAYMSAHVNHRRGSGDVRNVAQTNLVAGVSVLGLTFVLVPPFGAAGGAWAWTLGLLFTTFTIALRHRRDEPAMIRVALAALVRRISGDGAARRHLAQAITELGLSVEIGRVLSSSDGVTVATGLWRGRVVIVRVGRGSGIAQLERHVAGAQHLCELGGQAAIVAPEVRHHEIAGDVAVVLEAVSPGASLSEVAGPDHLVGTATVLATQLRKIDPTAQRVVVDSGLLDGWTVPGIEMLRRTAGDEHADRVRGALELGLLGREVEVGFVHGDASVDNCRVDASVGLAGLVDLETWWPEAPLFVDSALLAMSAYRDRDGAQFGRQVVEALRTRAAEGTDRGQSGVSADTAALLAWLLHVTANERKDAAYAQGSVWWRYNVTPVLRELVVAPREAVPSQGSQVLQRLVAQPVRSLRRRHRRARAVPARERFAEVPVEGREWGRLALLVGAVALWVGWVSSVDPLDLGTYGLVSALGLWGWAALAGVTWVVLRQMVAPTAGGYAGWTALAATSVMLQSAPALVFGSPRYPWTWKHLGIVDYIDRFQSVDPSIADGTIYHSWPGFFAAVSGFSQASGISAETLAVWTPPALAVLHLGGVVYLLGGLTRRRDLVFAGAWFYVLANWVGQEYFSPQGVAFLMYLGFVGVLLRAVREHGEGSSTRWGLRWRASIAVCLAVALAVSHQLTPLMLILAVGALFVSRFIRQVWVPVAAAALQGAVFFLVASDYIAANLAAELEAVGGVVENVNTGSSTFGVVSAESARVALASRLLVVLFLLMAACGVIARWRRGHRDRAALALLAAPVTAVMLSGFGGEMLFRVVLFTSPVMGFFAAAALLAVADRWPGKLTSYATAMVLVPLFVLATLGRSHLYHFSDDEIETVGALLAEAPEGSLLVEGSRAYPNRFIRHEALTAVPISREGDESVTEFLEDPGPFVARWLDGYDSSYALFTSSMIRDDLVLGTFDGRLTDAVEEMRSSPELEILVESEDVVIFVLAGERTDDG